MQLDILAFGAHPDDVELSCGGTLLSHIAQGKTAGIIDLTRGELGTRGSVALRHEEATEAARILGVSARDNLGFADGFFANDPQHQLAVIRSIRQYRPEVVLTNATDDRHPDHGRACQLVTDSCFLAGLSRIVTYNAQGQIQKPHRPQSIYHCIQDRLLIPDFVVDVTPFFERKMEAVLAFKSQFYNPESAEPNTYIAEPSFLERVRNRHIDFGRPVGFQYAEGFKLARYAGVKNLFHLF